MSDYTPGPWRDMGRGMIVHNENGITHHVAQVFNRPADVSLVAAAPALLEALEMMLENAEIDALNEDVPGIEEARAALALARGEK